jgi:pyruvate dehydrogenase E1 component alpha subunit
MVMSQTEHGDRSEPAADVQVEMLRRMWRIRRFDEAALKMVRRGTGIRGAVHISIGQEAAEVGACLALRPDDYMVGYHRSHGHPLAKGASMRPLMAELMGKRTGVCKGKGGSMHLADFSVGSLGETAIVGSGIPVAVGAAYSAQIRDTDQVALCFFGDGAANIGAFHEGLNLAAIWQLGVIFVAENNMYAMSTPIAKTMSVPNIADRAVAYGMPGVVVDGQDVLQMYEVASEAVTRARSGGGPTLIEAKTYRYRDHAEYGNQDMSHRSQEEIDHWMARDPIDLWVARLLDNGVLSKEQVEDINREVLAEMEDSVRFANESPLPEPHELYEDLWATPWA